MKIIKITIPFVFFILISCKEINWNLNEKPLLEKVKIEYVDSNSCQIAIDFGYSKSNQLNPEDLLELQLFQDTNDIIITSIITEKLVYGTNSCKIEDLNPNTKYYFKFLAKNHVGNTETHFYNFRTLNTGGLASVYTSSSNINNGSVNIFGELINMGANNVISLGFCLSTSSNPTISNTILNVPIQLGNFNFPINNLQSNTTYFFRAFAQNTNGISYGEILTFHTPLIPILPTISTNSPSNLMPLSSTCSVQLNGTISNSGSSQIINRGFFISTNQSSILTGSQLNSASSNGLFSYTVNDLLPQTNYYARSFAQNNEGISYGDIVSFITPSLLALGDNYQGGIIGYIYQLGDQGYIQNQVHGIIVASNDQVGYSDPAVDYSIVNNQYYGANLSGLGNAGQQNTTTLVNSIGSGNYAAKICSDLVLNGYSDWYLPTINEFQKIRQGWYLNNIGFSGGLNHWTSTEVNTTDAYEFDTYGNTAYSVSKTTNGRVRAFRRF